MEKNIQNNEGLHRALREELGKIHLVDAHDHLLSEEAWLAEKEDFTALLGYAWTDLTNAGMSRDELVVPEAGDEVWTVDYGYDYEEDLRSVDEKWEVIKPYWPYVRHMGSAQVTRKALSMFFDCEDLTDSTLPSIQKKLDQLKNAGAYAELLKERTKIDTICNVVMSVKENPASDLIAPQLYTDTFAAIQKRRDIYRLEQRANQDIYSLETYLKALDSVLEEEVKQGLKGIKWHIFPYLRDMEFDIPNMYDAAKCFDRILQMPARGGAVPP